MPSILYESGKAEILSGALDRPLRVMLVTADYKPSPSHTNRLQIADESRGQGYPPGGLVLSGQKIVSGSLVADPISIPKATLSARAAVLYSPTGALIAYIDFGETKTSTNGPFVVNCDERGILSFR